MLGRLLALGHSTLTVGCEVKVMVVTAGSGLPSFALPRVLSVSPKVKEVIKNPNFVAIGWFNLETSPKRDADNFDSKFAPASPRCYLGPSRSPSARTFPASLLQLQVLLRSEGFVEGSKPWDQRE